MKNENTDAQTDLFSSDPEENLRIENEILHLRIKAELGGEIMGNGMGKELLPPDVENQFLKNILEFERAYANTRQIKIYEFLGKPSFKKPDELNDEELESALNELRCLLESKNISLDFSSEYDVLLKYKFIIEELFEHEIDDVEIPGLITHYIYEEFHPNHASDIESRAIEFIEGWIDQEIDEDSWELAETFILPDRTTMAKSDVLGKISTVFDSYKEYTLSSYTFDKIHFELKEENETGMGYAGGSISYDAVLENGEMIHIEGHFYICLSLEYKWWNIFYFDFPGFVW